MTLAYFALNRFGLGAKPGEASSPDLADPKAWVVNQIFEGTPTSDFLKIVYSGPDFQAYMAEVRRRTPWTGEMSVEVPSQKANNAWAFGHEIADAGVRSRFEDAVYTHTPFISRLMHFWSNHFAVGREDGATAGHLPYHEFVQIRENLFGSFSGLVLAASPGSAAMSTYLTNWSSFGMNSSYGKGRKGMNENLGRELLELHMLGVNAGYTQEDVAEMAKALTGWTFNGWVSALEPVSSSLRLGAKVFDHRLHEPGERTVFGYVVNEDDGTGSQVKNLVRLLATTQECATYICRKLLVHFLEDDPSPDLVTELSSFWMETEGSLPSVYMKLVDICFREEESFSVGGLKRRTYWDWACAYGKLLAGNGVTNAVDLFTSANVGNVINGDESTWRVTSPAGHPDTKSSYSVYEMARRYNYMQYQTNRLTPVPDHRVMNIEVVDWDSVTRRVLTSKKNTSEFIRLLGTTAEFNYR